MAMRMKRLIGYDIGGTKCCVLYGTAESDSVKVRDKIRFETTDVDATIRSLFSATRAIMSRNSLTAGAVHAAGVSCGGPLDSRRGVIMSPPNLPGWDDIRIVDMIQKEFGIPAAVQNDANACALAEWKFGAGRGTENMIFMTFGTGLGAGLILDGHLYSGTNDNAGEIGHIRLSDFGPVGYGKAGSFEGFCSGGGMAQLAKSLVREKLQMGESPALCPDYESIDSLTAKKVAEYADAGDGLALEVCRITAAFLGRGISMLIDVLNPERVVIGSIYERAAHLFREQMEAVIMKEALPNARKVCRVVPADLGVSIGDIAALSVAAEASVPVGFAAANAVAAVSAPKEV